MLTPHIAATKTFFHTWTSVPSAFHHGALGSFYLTCRIGFRCCNIWNFHNHCKPDREVPEDDDPNEFSASLRVAAQNQPAILSVAQDSHLEMLLSSKRWARLNSMQLVGIFTSERNFSAFCAAAKLNIEEIIVFCLHRPFVKVKRKRGKLKQMKTQTASSVCTNTKDESSKQQGQERPRLSSGCTTDWVFFSPSWASSPKEGTGRILPLNLGNATKIKLILSVWNIVQQSHWCLKMLCGKRSLTVQSKLLKSLI